MKGLKRLEHRGYDSWGLFCSGPTKTKNEKYIGSISDVEALNLLEDNKFCRYAVCMGHTRWATHGEVSKVNTHPIISMDGKVHVVHNGIIENAQELKNEYGFKCIGDTDTEVFANIVATHLSSGDYSHDPLMEIARIADFINGDNAFVIHYQHDDWNNDLFAFVTGNGVLYANHGYVSSEINALAGFVHHAKKLDNKNAYNINRFGSVLSNADENEELHYIIVPDKHVKIDTDDPMLSEIKEQTNYGSVKYPLSVSACGFKMDKVILTGCGSSYYAGMFGQRCFEQIAGIEAQTKYATEFMHCSRQYNHRDYHYICLSQSGETKDTLDAIAPLPFDRTITITNNKYCTMKRYAKYNIDLNTGQEIGVAATKTFFQTCWALARMASREQSGIMTYDLYKFEEYIKDTIEQADKWAKEFVNIKIYSRYLFLGSSLTYPIALEGALKMKEIAYFSAEGMPASEIKHGPIALVDYDTLSIFVLSAVNKSNMNSILSNIQEIKSRHAPVLVICDDYINHAYNLNADWVHVLPQIISTYGCEHIMSSLACVIPLQLLAYYTAIREGYNPNRPRNLAKCVTV